MSQIVNNKEEPKMTGNNINHQYKLRLDRIIPLLSIVIFSIITFVYLKSSTTNVPIMDYWRYIVDLTEKVFTGGFGLSDLWESGSGHRAGLQYLLTAINIRFFGMNTLIGIYGGFILTVITCIYFYGFYRNSIIAIDKNKILKSILYVTVVMAFFNINQWEIFGLAFSLYFALRKLLYIVIFVLISNLIIHKEIVPKRLIMMLSLLFITMCFISGGYLAGLIGTIIAVLIISAIINIKDIRNRFYISYVVLFVVMGLGLFLYSYGLKGLGGEGSSIFDLFQAIINGSIFKGLFIMLGSSIAHYELVSKLGIGTIWFGVAVLAIYVLAFFIFFSKKMYKKSYVPIMLMLYSLINILIIFYARASLFNLEYLSSSRYVCETTLGLVGALFIVIEYLCSFEVSKLNWKKMISIVSILIICIALFASGITEGKIAPYRKQYQLNLVKIMRNIDNYSDDELTPFQANNALQVREGVNLMKKYKMGIFGDKENDKVDKIDVGNNLKTSQKTGYFDDGWVEKVSLFTIKTGEKGIVKIKGYYPNNITGNEALKIYVGDNQLMEYSLKDNLFEIPIDTLQKSAIVTIKIVTNFQITPDNGDQRELSFVLTDMQGE